jgi:hypothetical protein
MNSIIHADLLELKARFETWRTNRKYGAPSGAGID